MRWPRGAGKIDHEGPQQRVRQTLIFIKLCDVEQVARVLPIKGCMDFAAIEVFEGNHFRLRKPELLYYEIANRHRLSATNDAARHR